jgi:peptidoglycan/LPS O-acetylase OafA/YrhL
LEAPSARARESHGSRLAAVDCLKAAAIVAVAVNHAGPFLMARDVSEFDRIVRGGLVAFHVPTFLVVSGFLYQRGAPQSAAAVGRRLLRFLPAYALASLVALALGFSPWRDAGDVLRHLALGSAVGTYYYFLLLTLFVLAIWPLSRLSRGGVLALFGLYGLYQVAGVLFPRLAPFEPFFWFVRNPIHFVGYFLCGWLAAAWRDEASRLAARHRAWLWAAALAGIGAWAAIQWWPPPLWARGFLRGGYTLSVVWVVVELTRGRGVPALVRFLSDSTLTLYLYHHMIELALGPSAEGLPDPVRTALLVLAGLGGASVLVWLGRALLGRRSRWVLGA